MSPSRMPTRLPRRARASARLTETVVLPTPPFPAPTAITFLAPGSGGRPVSGADADRTFAVNCTSTADTPGSARTAAVACSRICSLTGHAGVVSSIVKETRSAAMATSLTKPSDTISRRRSGSTTTRSALSTASRSGIEGISQILSRGCGSERRRPEQLAPLAGAQDPQRVNPERRAKWQDEQVHHRESQRQHAPERQMAPHQHARPDVRAPPEQREGSGQREERGKEPGAKREIGRA